MGLHSMKRWSFTRIIMPLGLLFFLVAFANTPETWILGSTRVQFKGTAVEGYFEGVKGKLQFNEAQLSASSFDLYLEVASISTGNELKDEHARGTKWFNASKYPHIRFTSSSFEKVGKGYIVEGSMQIKGVKRIMRIPFSLQETDKGIQLQSIFSVNRSDFNIEGNAMSFLVGEQIRVSLSLPLHDF
jgi:polyisoprenoid-binding protein YceI